MDTQKYNTYYTANQESNGYFSLKEMDKNTLPFGQFPKTMIKGNPNKKYILSITGLNLSSYNSIFSIAILELDEINQTRTLVYGISNSDECELVNPVLFSLILERFNIVLITTDEFGKKLIEKLTNNSEFNDSKYKNLNYFSESIATISDKEKIERYKKYNEKLNSICLLQSIENDDFKKINHNLQYSINYRQLFFSSYNATNDPAIERANAFIIKTKKQCSLIESRYDTKMGQYFSEMKGYDEKNLNYIALLLVDFGAEIYQEIQDVKQSKSQQINALQQDMEELANQFIQMNPNCRPDEQAINVRYSRELNAIIFNDKYFYELDENGKSTYNDIILTDSVLDNPVDLEREAKKFYNKISQKREEMLKTYNEFIRNMPYGATI